VRRQGPEWCVALGQLECEGARHGHGREKEEERAPALGQAGRQKSGDGRMAGHGPSGGRSEAEVTRLLRAAMKSF
jgi:hypothetical protein